MARKKIVAGNWKMNLNLDEATQLIQELMQSPIELKENKEVVICPPALYLEKAIQQIQGHSNYSIGAQNCHQLTNGAYTGEISASMLQSVGAEYVIIGHSERREYYNESNELLTQKVNTALAAGLKVIFCFGEPLNIREEQKQNNFVKQQISDSIFHLSEEQLRNVVFAYEPIWAIGTGKTATKEQAQEMHAFVRTFIKEQFGTECAENLTILYGGSCKPDNANELFSQKDVDGGLIGGASLKASDFKAIIHAINL